MFSSKLDVINQSIRGERGLEINSDESSERKKKLTKNFKYIRFILISSKLKI